MLPLHRIVANDDSYPEIKLYASRRLPVEAPHALYLEDSGDSYGIPSIIVHGRYDMICMLDNAVALHNL